MSPLIIKVSTKKTDVTENRGSGMNEKSVPLTHESKTLQYIYAALGHAIRYDVIKYLGAFHRPVSYTELVEWLQVKPGSFYFHLKKMGHLVSQDDEKRFFLTPTGNLALDIIKSGENLRSQQIVSVTETKQGEITPPKRFSIILFGELIRQIAFNNRFKVFILLIMMGQILLLDLSKLGTIPFFLDGNLYFNIIVCTIELIGSILVIWILLEVIMKFLSPIKGFSYELLTGIPLAMCPLFIYPLLVILASNLEFLATLLSSPVFSIGLIFILQIITAIFLVQLLQVIKTVNFERALIPVFIILYGFSVLSFLITSLFPM